MTTPFEKQLISLVRLFKAANIKYAIIGGVAVLLYGETRLTTDVDVSVSIGQGNIEAFLKLAKKYGFCPIPRNIRNFIKKTAVIPMIFHNGDDVGRCDIILAQNMLEYQALNRALIRKIGAVSAKVITAEDLIVHKITSSRPKDIEDLKGIIYRQKGKLDIKYIKFWLKKIDRVNKKSQLSKLFDKLVSKRSLVPPSAGLGIQNLLV